MFKIIERIYRGPEPQRETFSFAYGPVAGAGATEWVGTEPKHNGTTCTCYYNEGGCPVCPPVPAGWDVCSTGRENCRDICCR
jgi:hypothetical protein